MSEYQALISALAWHIDADIAETLDVEAQDRTQILPVYEDVSPSLNAAPASAVQSLGPPLGAAAAKVESEKLASQAQTLDELKTAIQNFDGLAIRKTATNMVFSDGNPKADVMLIGEAPGADEDRQGIAFVGVSGQLLDRIFACLDISRQNESAESSLYISNILNWRPPGNRTPSPAEIEISLPFIRRHIELVAPKIIVFAGGVSAKSLLNQNLSVSKLRKGWHEYEGSIPAMVTYHPAFLLRNPAQKKAVWMDMIKLMKKREELGIVRS